MAAGGAGGRLVQMCIEAAVAAGAEGVERWRLQKRSMERLPPLIADALLRRLAERRLLYPSLLELFQYCVEEINLSGNNLVDAEWLAYLGAFRYLRILNLADCKAVNNSAIWSISGITTLIELDLSRCSRITDAGIKHIITIQCLERLHLSGTGITDRGVILLSSLRSLSLLDLGGISFSNKTFLSLQVLTKLEHLDIWGSAISNSGVFVLEAFPCLSFLSVAWTDVTVLPILSSVRCLDMSNCKVEYIFGDGVESSTYVPLSKVILSGSTIGNWSQLFRSVERSSIKHLDMSRCSISNLDFLEEMKNIEHLDLSATGVSDSMIEHITSVGMTLNFLSLKDTKITSDGVCSLVGGVANLTHLSLAHTAIDDFALVYISMIPSLRNVDLSQNNIKGFTDIREDRSERTFSLIALQALKYLEDLNLEDTKLTDEFLFPLSSCAALKSLYLRSDFLSDAGLHILSSAANLMFLGFRGNIMSDSGLLEFVAPAALRMLDLRGCWLLTSPAISKFCNDNPQIEVRHEHVQTRAEQSTASQVHVVNKVHQLKSKALRQSQKSTKPLEHKFIDERIRYSREELMQMHGQHSAMVSLAVQQLPSELRGSNVE